MRTWSFIAVGDDRQYGGNSGYNDDVLQVYRYDSNVANSKQVAVGDVAVLRDKRAALGIAQITKVDAEEGVKLIRRCPECRITGIKRRKRATPEWRCDNKHEFTHPVEQAERVRSYAAWFGETYRPLSQPLPADRLKLAALRPSDQMSIEELDARVLAEMLTNRSSALELLDRAALAATLVADDADEKTTEATAFKPTMADGRETTLRAIKARRGQKTFRNRLIRRYGARCLVTGCEVVDLLEAAHILPYRGSEYNHVSNGLLLRSDLHTLFDLHLMWINPFDLSVGFAPPVAAAGYGHLSGRRVVSQDQPKPSTTALRLRYAAAQQLGHAPRLPNIANH